MYIIFIPGYKYVVYVWYYFQESTWTIMDFHLLVSMSAMCLQGGQGGMPSGEIGRSYFFTMFVFG